MGADPREKDENYCKTMPLIFNLWSCLEDIIVVNIVKNLWEIKEYKDGCTTAILALP